MRIDLKNQAGENFNSLIFLFISLISGATLAGYLIGHYFPGIETSDGLLGAFIAASLATLFFLLLIIFGKDILLITTFAKRVTKYEDKFLFEWTEKLAKEAGIPCPEIFILPEDSLNIFSAGTSPRNSFIAITAGARHNLDKEEIQGLLAHEVAHIARHDSLLLMTVALTAGLSVLITDWFIQNFHNFFNWRSANFFVGIKNFIISISSLIIFGLLALIFFLFTPLVTVLMQFAISQSRDLQADRLAATLTQKPSDLISALNKCHQDQNIFQFKNRATEHLFIVNPDIEKRFRYEENPSNFAAHPDINLRIKNLGRF